MLGVETSEADSVNSHIIGLIEKDMGSTVKYLAEEAKRNLSGMIVRVDAS